MEDNKVIEENIIDKNTLRDRADKSEDITDDMWKLVPESTRYFYDEYFKMNSNLSPKTLIQYRSALKIFFYYVYVECDNRPIWKLKKSMFIKYINELQIRGLGSSAMKVKRYAVSSFCNTMEVLSEETDEDSKYPEMEKFKHFARVKIEIAKNQTYDKKPITQEEFDLIEKTLLEKGEYMALGYIGIAYNIASRRAETLQLKTEILTYEKKDGQNFVFSNPVRGKGKSVDGKILKYMVNDDAIKYMQLILDNRNFESEYLFAKSDGSLYSVSWVNDIFKKKISPIVERRISSHNCKSSAITHLLEKGVPMSVVSKFVAHHNSEETTKLYDLRDDEEELNNIFS